MLKIGENTKRLALQNLDLSGAKARKSYAAELLSPYQLQCLQFQASEQSVTLPEEIQALDVDHRSYFPKLSMPC